MAHKRTYRKVKREVKKFGSAVKTVGRLAKTIGTGVFSRSRIREQAGLKRKK